MQNAILKLRKDNRMTQQQLAAALGITRSHLARIEKGAATSDEIVLRLSRMFDLDAREIFFG